MNTRRQFLVGSAALAAGAAAPFAEVARRAEVPCFCADLTVSPVNVEWNKIVAGMLPAFPGICAMGLVESNGHQNYAKWDEMRSRLPDPTAPWVVPKGGVYDLGGDYWKMSGNVLAPLPYYEEAFAFKTRGEK